MNTTSIQTRTQSDELSTIPPGGMFCLEQDGADVYVRSEDTSDDVLCVEHSLGKISRFKETQTVWAVVSVTLDA